MITNLLVTTYTIFAENPCYWRNISIPAMVEGTDLIIYYYNYIYKADKLPCFDFPYHLQIFKLNFTKLNLTKDTHNERLFINEIKEVAPDYKLLFTDASVEPANHTCGIGIYGRTWTSIAKRFAGNNKTGCGQEQDYITLSTREEIVKASQKGDVKLIWVPSHTGITAMTCRQISSGWQKTKSGASEQLSSWQKFLRTYKRQTLESMDSKLQDGHTTHTFKDTMVLQHKIQQQGYDFADTKDEDKSLLHPYTPPQN
nr:unnamed protein product [Callosobruchus analis]